MIYVFFYTSSSGWTLGDGGHCFVFTSFTPWLLFVISHFLLEVLLEGCNVLKHLHFENFIKIFPKLCVGRTLAHVRDIIWLLDCLGRVAFRWYHRFWCSFRTFQPKFGHLLAFFWKLTSFFWNSTNFQYVFQWKSIIKKSFFGQWIQLLKYHLKSLIKTKFCICFVKLILEN